MLRVYFAFIVIAALVSCTNTPSAETSAPTETVLRNAASEASPDLPGAEETLPNTAAANEPASIQEFPVPAGSHAHDVAPAPDGTVWYTAQAAGELGRLDPATGDTHHIPLGSGSMPHGVIVGPDGAPWITDGGLNAIVRVDPQTEQVKVFRLPDDRRNANLNTAAFDKNGILWFTEQNGMYGRFDPSTEEMQTFDAPRGRGPYGITATPDGSVY